MSEPRPIAELVPHAPPMLLLDRLVAVEADHIVVELQVRSDGLFDDDGRVPAIIGLEYMAQAVSAFSHLHKPGEAVKLGFLLGTRRFETSAETFACGDILRVRVSLVMRDAEGMAAFDCELRGPGVEQAARLVVFEPDDPDAYVAAVQAGRWQD